MASLSKTFSIISPPSCHKLEIITCESSSELICYKIVSHEDLRRCYVLIHWRSLQQKRHTTVTVSKRGLYVRSC
jgi:hypothetical protein